MSGLAPSTRHILCLTRPFLSGKHPAYKTYLSDIKNVWSDIFLSDSIFGSSGYLNSV